MLFTPEMSGLLDRNRERAAAQLHDEADDPVLAAVRKAAAGAGTEPAKPWLVDIEPRIGGFWTKVRNKLFVSQIEQLLV